MHSTPNTSDALGSRRVLVLDDERSLLEMLDRRLSAAGDQCQAADNVSEACAVLNGASVDRVTSRNEIATIQESKASRIAPSGSGKMTSPAIDQSHLQRPLSRHVREFRAAVR
jgi:CheY-like chemotaxis protein